MARKLPAVPKHNANFHGHGLEPVYIEFDIISGYETAKGLYFGAKSAVKWGLGKAAAKAIILGNDAATLANAARMVPEKGIQQLLVHGHYDYFIVDGVVKSPKEIARIMLQSGFNRGTPIRSISCHTGACIDGAAYQLSRYLKSPVLAPTDKVRILQGGEYQIFGNGYWKQF